MKQKITNASFFWKYKIFDTFFIMFMISKVLNSTFFKRVALKCVNDSMTGEAI